MPSVTYCGAPWPCRSQRISLLLRSPRQPSLLPAHAHCLHSGAMKTYPGLPLDDSCGCLWCCGPPTWWLSQEPSHGMPIPGCCSLAAAWDWAPRCRSGCEHFLNSFLQLSRPGTCTAACRLSVSAVTTLTHAPQTPMPFQSSPLPGSPLNWGRGASQVQITE